MTEALIYDGAQARQNAKQHLPDELQQILADYDYLIGHPGSEALCECLSELLGGRTVRYCGGAYRPWGAGEQAERQNRQKRLDQRPLFWVTAW